MSIKNRIAKLETKRASGGLVLINFYPGDGEDALLRERFGENGPTARCDGNIDSQVCNNKTT